MLVAMTSYAQEEKKDSVQISELEGVIINATLKKDSEYVNKMPLKAIENPQLFSTVDNFEYAVMKIILSVTNIILAVAYIMFAVYNF